MINVRSVLIIEDDQTICEVVRLHLLREGFTVDSVADGDEGLQKVLEGSYSIVLLDLQLQGLGGIDVCKRIREAANHVPIIMLTSRSGEIDKVIGLEIGADDYVTKPFSVYELTARIRARLRATEHASIDSAKDFKEEGHLLVFGALIIDTMRLRVTIDDQLIELTPKEYEVLVFLAQRPGRPFTREDLLEAVWDINAAGYADTVTALMRRLRSKLEKDSARPLYIKTVRGIGYRFAEVHEIHSPSPNSHECEEDA